MNEHADRRRQYYVYYIKRSFFQKVSIPDILMIKLSPITTLSISDQRIKFSEMSFSTFLVFFGTVCLVHIYVQRNVSNVLKTSIYNKIRVLVSKKVTSPITSFPPFHPFLPITFSFFLLKLIDDTELLASFL